MSDALTDDRVSWLQGGPFLEVSFLLPLVADRRDMLEQLLLGLGRLTTKVEVMRGHEVVLQESGSFIEGYPADDADPGSERYHTTRIDLLFHLDTARQSSLIITQISSGLVCVDFCFFGSEFDAPEWNQKGITSSSQLSQFRELLIRFSEAFDFVAGLVAFETDAIDLFGLDSSWPDEAFQIDMLRNNWKLLLGRSNIITLMTNNKYIDLEVLDGSTCLENYTVHLPQQ